MGSSRSAASQAEVTERAALRLRLSAGSAFLRLEAEAIRRHEVMRAEAVTSTGTCPTMADAYDSVYQDVIRGRF